MKDRILMFLSNENRSSARFAADIGVQPSSVSHILSGRNNPSLDFVMKMLKRYPYLSTEWLLFGTGKMYNQQAEPTLFDQEEPYDTFDNEITPQNEEIITTTQSDVSGKRGSLPDDSADSHKPDSKRKSAVKIVIFYNDNTFEQFQPVEGGC